MSHTPGKWEVREPFSYKLDGASIWVVQPTGSMLVAQVAGLAGFDYSNAKIISTAPDGLALAEMVIEAGTGKLTGGPIQPHYVDWIAIVAAARALVEKVGGK